MKVNIIHAKSIFQKTSLPGCDFVINPYSGCTFGCTYCYADFTRKFQGHLQDKWGEYVDIRENAAEILDKEIKSFVKNFHKYKPGDWKNGKFPIVLLSSVCDPYQGVEAKYKITRQCLEVLLKNKFPGEISILTKSPIVERDIDLFKQFPQIQVGMTITSTDDEISLLFEKNAPPSSIRLKTLAKLNAENIPTYVCISPVLPHFVANPERLENLFTAIKNAGTTFAFIEHINLSGNKMKRLLEEMKDKIDYKIVEEIWFSQSDEYKRKLESTINDLIKKVGLEVWGGGVIDHEELDGKTVFKVG